MWRVLCLSLLLVPHLAWAATRLDDEGVALGYINALNCVGAGITCTKSGITGTVTVSGLATPVTIANGGTNAASFNANGVVYANSGATALTNLTTFTFDGTSLTLPVGANLLPSSNSTTALNVANAAGTAFVTFDTSNKRLQVGAAPTTNSYSSSVTFNTSSSDGLALQNKASGGKQWTLLLPATGSSLVAGSLTVTDSTDAFNALILTSTGTTIATSATTPIVYGGTAAGSTATISGTSNGSPSNAYVILNGTSQGNVGIGTTSPTESLQVNGNVILESANPSITLLDTTGTNAVNLHYDLQAFYPGASLQFGTYASGVFAQGNSGYPFFWFDSNNANALLVYGQYASKKNTIATAVSPTVNWNLGNVQMQILANGANTFTFSNPKDGGRYILILKQPPSGASGTVTWPGTVLWSGGTAPTLTTTASKADLFSFVYDGASYYGVTALNF